MRGTFGCAAALVLILDVAPRVLHAQSPSALLYEDPAGRFAFSYPSTFGSTSAGSNDRFGDRLAAVRFSTFPGQYGGEAVLTGGFPLIDLQAVGGLYDSLTLEIFPDALRARIVGQLPRLTAENFCAALGQPHHVDPDLPAFSSFTAPEKRAIRESDVMRNANPRVIECRRAGDIVTFDKERAFQAGYPAQHVYGAVRFLREPFSTFQLIAGGAKPDGAILATIANVVSSFMPR
jgi:hypothetical protein